MRFYKTENSYLQIARESSFGTENLTDMEQIGRIVDSVDLPDPVRNQEAESYISTERTADRIVDGQINLTGGSVSVKPVDMLPFYMLLGKEDSNGDAVLVPDGQDKLSYTMQAVNEGGLGNDLVRTYRGVVGGGGTITASNDDELLVDLDLQAVDYSDDETKKQSNNLTKINNGDGWHFSDASLIDMFGVQFEGLQELEIDIEQNSDERHFIGNGDDKKPDAIVFGQAEVNATVTLSVQKLDLWNEFTGQQNEFDTTITFDNGSQVIDIELTGCKIDEAPHSIPEEEEIQVDAEIIAKGCKIVDNSTTSA